jgi:hypothetical protein
MNGKVALREAEAFFHERIPITRTKGVRVIRAICARPDEKTLDAFKNALAQKGRARITLRVKIEEKSEVAAEFEGTFVALAR